MSCPSTAWSGGSRRCCRRSAPARARPAPQHLGPAAPALGRWTPAAHWLRRGPTAPGRCIPARPLGTLPLLPACRWKQKGLRPTNTCPAACSRRETTRTLLGMHIIDQMTKKLDFLWGRKGAAGCERVLPAELKLSSSFEKRGEATEISCDCTVHTGCVSNTTVG